MQQLNRVVISSAAGVLVVGAVLLAQSDPKPKTEPKRPQVLLKATPASGLAPVRIVGVVDLKGGDDDFEEYYCPTIEWDWDDGTVSESSNDCEPYERGKSIIKRKYTLTHTYKQGGRYRLTFKLKQKQKVVGGANTGVQLLGGEPF